MTCQTSGGSQILLAGNSPYQVSTNLVLARLAQIMSPSDTHVSPGDSACYNIPEAFHG